VLSNRGRKIPSKARQSQEEPFTAGGHGVTNKRGGKEDRSPTLK